ncbi:MAG TPA: FkbM family methyltransferase, partial [Ruminiclostridium sp.]|nr:FkbM family methyltransferase [Ruminiclostridium sp.]
MLRILAGSFEQAVKHWFQDKGDATLRLNYDLTKDSVVFDLGGYKGQWAGDIFGRYGCGIYIFEPVELFYKEIVNRFKDTPKIQVFQYGLSDENKICKIGLDQDGSSIYKSSQNTEEISLVKATDFISQQRIERIDVLKVNIEGGEYDLLDHLIQSGSINLVANLQIQFHNCPEIPDVM